MGSIEEEMEVELWSKARFWDGRELVKDLRTENAELKTYIADIEERYILRLDEITGLEQNNIELHAMLECDE